MLRRTLSRCDDDDGWSACCDVLACCWGSHIVGIIRPVPIRIVHRALGHEVPDGIHLQALVPHLRTRVAPPSRRRPSSGHANDGGVPSGDVSVPVDDEGITISSCGGGGRGGIFGGALPMRRRCSSSMRCRASTREVIFSPDIDGTGGAPLMDPSGLMSPALAAAVHIRDGGRSSKDEDDEGWENSICRREISFICMRDARATSLSGFIILSVSCCCRNGFGFEEDGSEGDWSIACC